MAAGRHQAARPLFERIVEEDTTRTTARGYRAQIRARAGDRPAAEREIEWQLSRGGEKDGGETIIHAAAMATELGDEERAVQLARRAIARGFSHTHRSVHRQPRLEVLWRIPAARALLEPQG